MGRVAGALTAGTILIVVAMLSWPARAHEPPTLDVSDPALAAALHARVFTDDDGIPQNSIESLRFSPDGLLWATTREGAASFDGWGWTPLSMPKGAGTNWPRVTLASTDGGVWFATEGGGLHRYRDGSWSSISDPRLDRTTVTAITETTSPRTGHSIWAGSPAGLFRIDERNMQVSLVATPDAASVTALYAGPSELLAGTIAGSVLRCDATLCVADADASALVAGRRITGFVEQDDPAGGRTTWIATDGGVAVLGRERRGIELEGKRVNAIAITHDPGGSSTPWVALDGDGILARLDGRWLAPAVVPAIPNGFVFALAPYPLAGASRHMFAGTLNGVVRIDLGAWRSIDADAGLPDSSVVSILETRSGERAEYLLGTTAGLATFRAGTWSRVDSDLLARTPVFALFESGDGSTIHAGTNAGLVTRRNGRWSEEDPASGLPTRESVVSLLETTAGNERRLWAGTYGAGLWSRDPLGKWHRTEGLPDGHIEALAAETRDGVLRVWAATNRGLARIEGNSVTVVDRESGLPSDIVRCLRLATGADGKNYLWVGTASGISWREAANDEGVWDTLSASSGATMPGDNVYQIRSASATQFWLFTGRGVVRVTFPRGARPAASNATLETFTTADGLPGNECNFGASMIDSVGRIWAGTTRGAAIFDPGSEAVDRSRKTLAIVNARALPRSIDITRQPALRHDDNDVVFSFRLVDPGRGDRALYRTQLVGQDEVPGAWIRERERNFSGIRPGNYTFRVWGRDSAGNVSGPVEQSFRVVAPSWRAWWAILAYIAAAIAVLAALHRLRIETLSVRAEKLERVVRSRTRDLERMNRELEAANAALADMSVTDPLTGAKNRRFLGQQMERDAGRVGRSLRNADDLMFFVVDIDLFKNVNDSFGHTVGDAILRQFCGTLASAVRESDTIVRWGGEEFLVVARRSSRAEATRIADRIIEIVRAEVFDAFDGRMIQLTCSLGWAVFPFVPNDPGLFTWEEVVEIADQCLLAAKASGRDCWVGLSAGSEFSGESFFQRFRTSARTMAEAGELEISTSQPDPARLHWP